MCVAALQGRRTATLQACDLHKQCAVRELNPQPADYSQSRLTLTTMGQSSALATQLVSEGDCRCLPILTSKRALSGHQRHVKVAGQPKDRPLDQVSSWPAQVAKKSLIDAICASGAGRSASLKRARLRSICAKMCRSKPRSTS